MVRKRVRKTPPKPSRPRGGASVPCPVCAKDSEVVITRRMGQEVSRRRKCKGKPSHEFYSIEAVVTEVPS